MTTHTSSPQDWHEGRRLRAWPLKQQGWKWVRRARTKGIESLRRVLHPGGPSKLRPYQQLALLEMLRMGAENFGFRGAVWSTPRVVALARHFLGISYHPERDLKVGPIRMLVF